eukprot:9094267-Pyramimonas_sp.AAC.4
MPTIGCCAVHSQCLTNCTAPGANQTYNVFMNYHNRGDGAGLDPLQLGFAYTAATSSACGIVYLGNRLVARRGVSDLSSTSQVSRPSLAPSQARLYCPTHPNLHSPANEVGCSTHSTFDLFSAACAFPFQTFLGAQLGEILFVRSDRFWKFDK